MLGQVLVRAGCSGAARHRRRLGTQNLALSTAPWHQHHDTWHSKMIWIAVDAMGGDFAPRHVVDGALAAARHFDLGVMLVGAD